MRPLQSLFKILYRYFGRNGCKKNFYNFFEVRLFENKKDNGPKIARLYGGSLANSDFPIPGKCYPSRKGSSDDKPEPKLKSVAIHHIIREAGKPYATEIAEYEKQMEDMKKLKVNLVEEYTLLLLKATQEELTHYDVIFCTTAMATNTSIFKMLKNQIFQLIIDECGMCTEPECLATIVSTRAEQVVLIGDHMQLKPIIQCQQAQRLGLEESMFESYYKCQIKGKNSVQLKIQYRMVSENKVRNRNIQKYTIIKICMHPLNIRCNTFVKYLTLPPIY